MAIPYIYIWRYRVKRERLTEFLAAYGPGGEWVQLFRRSPGFIGTELLQNKNDLLQFITIDRWESEEAYNLFREERSAEYETLDRKCDVYTDREDQLGVFK